MSLDGGENHSWPTMTSIQSAVNMFGRCMKYRLSASAFSSFALIYVITPHTPAAAVPGLIGFAQMQFN